MNSPDARTDDRPATPAQGAAGTSPVLSKLPTCLAAVSALVYFLESEGIRNHLLLLQLSALKLAEYLP